MSESLLNKRVEWSSSSNGKTYTKEGVVIYDGEAVSTFMRWHEFGGARPSSWSSVEAWRELRGCGGSRDRTGYGMSANTGILVRVDKVDGKQLRKPRFYSPRRSALRVVA